MWPTFHQSCRVAELWPKSQKTKRPERTHLISMSISARPHTQSPSRLCGEKEAVVAQLKSTIYA